MFLAREKSTVDQLLPGLAAALKAKTLMELESDDGRLLVSYLRQYANPGLLVGAKLGGMAVDLVSAVRIHRYIGSLCPSLAVMMTMHNHTTYCLSKAMDASLANKDSLLSDVARDKLVFCSGFAEAKPGANILSSSVTCAASNGHFVINGSKKPCTMVDFADVALVGITNPNAGEATARGLLLVDNMRADKIEKVPFWPASILTATSSNELVFNGYKATAGNVVLMEAGEAPSTAKQAIENTELCGLSCFQLLIASSYLGAASQLAAQCFAAAPANATDASQIVNELESAALALEGAAALIDSHQPCQTLVALSVSVRTMVAQCIDRANRLALIGLGGMRYLAKEEIRYLLQVSQCLNFHPLSRNESVELIQHELCRASD
ncbi:acyl-CoA dehydrogenase family protein [Alkalimonas amylolytica]|uniref:Acyl-CoA dehydrogenase n=1 Tax=Alkalimonas amylolytica TaxID=152573 RepID=A0A1H4AWI9_ALKAM|nr:acyl-CoA dehydrogenase family protein [Alkalimonas amylolytica]SEA40249.1 Acyl-CoA dehydrogenase [Alkalimonas amylolytica]